MDRTSRSSRADSATTDAETSLGTTIVGVRTDERVVLASDQRASLGGMVSSKSVQKIEPVGDGVALAFTGSVSGAQSLTAELRQERRLYETRRGKSMSVGALATLTGNLMREQPRRVQHILGGVDDDGAQLYSFDGGGAALEHPFVAGGSGGQTAYGVLEAGYDDDFSLDAAKELASDAIRAATERDLASGNGLCLAVLEDGPVTVETFDGYDSAAESSAGAESSAS
ncbi:MAG: proteasome subunit beta [Halobaculum sp.]